MRIIEIVFTQEGSRGAIAIMDRLFREGWVTLEPTRYYPCGHYFTVLHKP